MSELWEDEELPDVDTDDWGEPEAEEEPAKKRHKSNRGRAHIAQVASQGTEDGALEVSEEDDFDVLHGSARSRPPAAAAAAPAPQPYTVPPPVASSRLKQSAKSAELQERLQYLQQIECAREDEPDSPLVAGAPPASRRPQLAARRQPHAAAAAAASTAAAAAAAAAALARQRQQANSDVVTLPDDEEEDGAVDWQQLAQDIGATASPERGKPGAAGAAVNSVPAAAVGGSDSSGEGAEVVELVFRCSNGSLKLAAPLEGSLAAAMEQFTAHAEQQGWLAPGKTAKFKFDGDRVTAAQTPSDLGVEDGDIIDVVL